MWPLTLNITTWIDYTPLTVMCRQLTLKMLKRKCPVLLDQYMSLLLSVTIDSPLNRLTFHALMVVTIAFLALLLMAGTKPGTSLPSFRFTVLRRKVKPRKSNDCALVLSILRRP